MSKEKVLVRRVSQTRTNNDLLRPFTLYVLISDSCTNLNATSTIGPLDIACYNAGRYVSARLAVKAEHLSVVARYSQLCNRTALSEDCRKPSTRLDGLEVSTASTFASR